MKTLVALLVMAVIFLSGIVFGMNREEAGGSPDYEAPAEQAGIAEREDIEEETPAVPRTSEMATQPEIAGDSPAFHTQKAASVLGEAVKGFFEIIMQFMYQTAQLFF